MHALSPSTGDIGTREARAGVRDTAGTPMVFTKGNGYTGGQGTTWLKLQRVGNTFTASQSTDGTRWFEVVSATIPMNNNYLVGMVIGSNSDAVISSHFDHVTITVE
jgi:hypothetical protein